ncbi:hypothetical protein WJR50_18805 [Catalinimonas sp. 4WD22]|uniref:hypothetical protein n=1 Tax=Catalinimonas locisalis TaxID=3133978 RepID=UPI0031019544
MTTYTYQYTDTQQQVQSVDVTVTYSTCADVVPSPDPQTSGYIKLRQKSITIEIPNSIPVDLDIYFDFEQTTYVQSNTFESTGTTFFTLKKNNRLQSFTFFCEEVRTQQYAQGQYRVLRDYEFIEQPSESLPEEPVEIEPDNPEEEPYSDVPRWWFEFEKLSEGYDPTVCRVEIFTKEATTGSTELAYMQDTPISIKRRGDSEDLFKPIIGGSCEVNFIAFQEDEFKSLFASRDGEAKIRYYEDSVLYFEGYSLGYYYSEAYTDPPYTIKATFSDGIALLKNRSFQSGYDEYRVPAIKVLHDVLAKIPSTLDIYTHIFSVTDNMPSPNFISPLQDTKIDVRTFKKDDGKPFSCYEVLEAICRTFGARFHSSNNEDKEAIWVIDEINSIIDYTNSYIVFGAGATTHKDKVNFFNRIISNVNDNRLGIIVNQSGLKKQKNLINEVQITEEKEFIFSLLPDRVNGYGEFNRSDVNQNPVRAWLASWDYNGDIYTVNKPFSEGGNVNRALEILKGDHAYNINGWVINDEDYIESEGVSVKGGNGFNLDMRLNFNIVDSYPPPFGTGQNAVKVLKLNSSYQPAYLPIQITLTDSSGNTQYSDANGFWSDNVQYIKILASQYDSFISFTLENILIPEDGEFAIRLFTPVVPWVPTLLQSDIDDLNGLLESVQIDYIKHQYLSENDFSTTKRTITLRNKSIKSSITEPYTFDLLLGDADTLENVSALSYDGAVTSGWTRQYVSGDTPLSISELAGVKILEQYNNSEAVILEDFEILENAADKAGGHYSFHKPIGLSQYPSRRFLPTDWEYVPKSNLGGQSRGGYIRATWVEIRNDSVSDLEIVVDEDTSTRKNNNYGSGGGGTVTITNNIENDYNIRDVLISGSPSNPVYVQLTDDNKLAVNLETVSGWTGTTPTLQQVTDQGNISTDSIIADSFKSGDLNYTSTGITQDTGDITISAQSNLKLSTNDINRITIQNDGDIYLNELTGSTTEMISITSDGRLSRMAIPNGSGGTVTIPSLQQVTDVGNYSSNVIESGLGFKTGVLEIENGLIIQKDLGGGGAPQSLTIKTSDSLFLSGSTGYVQMDYNGRTKFSNTTGATPTKLAGFSSDGYIGSLQLSGATISGDTIVISQPATPTLQQVTDQGNTTNNLVVFNNNIQVNTRVFGNSSTLNLSSENSALGGQISVNTGSIQMRTNGQSMMTVSTGFTQINSSQLILPSSVRWDKNLGSTKMLVLGANNLITTQDIPSFQNTDNYVTGATWNTSNGILTLNRQNGSTSVDLDNRYALISSSFSGDYNDLNNRPFDNLNSSLIYTAKELWLADLAGSGTRMVVANSNGVLSTQSIPSGSGSDYYVTGGTFNSSTRVLTLRRQNGSTNITLTNVLTSVPTLQQVTSAGASSNQTITLSSLSGSGTRMVVANSSGTLSTQSIPSGGGGGVSGTNNYIPVFDGSADGVGNSVIQQNVSGFGLVMNSNNFKIGNSSTSRIFVADGSTEYGTLQFENSGRAYWNRRLDVGEGLVLYDMATAPPANGNGCVLFSQGGVLKVRNSNGSIVTLS